MNRLATFALAVLLLLPAAAVAEERRHGVGIGFTYGAGKPEIGSRVDFIGGSVFGKFGITDHWGVHVTYRDLEDDEDDSGGVTVDQTQIEVSGVYMWRPGKLLRPHVRLGVVQTDIERSGPTFNIDEDGTSVSVGGGFELGSPKIAWFLDYDYTNVDLAGTDFDFANATSGVIFKF